MYGPTLRESHAWRTLAYTGRIRLAMSDRIRLALVITELHVGGAERCLVHLATGLDAARFALAVYSLAPRPLAGQDQLVRTLETAGVPVHFLDATSVRHGRRAIRRLRALLVAQRTQVVQSFLFHANVIASLAVRRMPPIRLVTGIRVADPSRWRLWLERRTSRRAERIACVSQSVADFCRQRVRLPPERLVVIPNGIDAARYPATPAASLAEFGVPAGRRVAVCIGRLHPQKGLDWLLSLSQNWLDRLPDHDLLLVGEGPERRALQRQAVALGLAQRVHFAGFRPDVPQLLAACQLALLPSRWEGMPNVLLEAMASGLPVVATRCEGVLELLGPLAAPQSVKWGDDQGFVDRIIHFADHPAEAAAVGRQNRQRVATHYSLAGMIHAYAGLYGS
jgi:glycosyltransferase involved in cell wall biosynthesis